MPGSGHPSSPIPWEFFLRDLWPSLPMGSRWAHARGEDKRVELVGVLVPWRIREIRVSLGPFKKKKEAYESQGK